MYRRVIRFMIAENGLAGHLLTTLCARWISTRSILVELASIGIATAIGITTVRSPIGISAPHSTFRHFHFLAVPLYRLSGWLSAILGVAGLGGHHPKVGVGFLADLAGCHLADFYPG